MTTRTWTITAHGRLQWPLVALATLLTPPTRLLHLVLGALGSRGSRTVPATFNPTFLKTTPDIHRRLRGLHVPFPMEPAVTLHPPDLRDLQDRLGRRLHPGRPTM